MERVCPGRPPRYRPHGFSAHALSTTTQVIRTCKSAYSPILSTSVDVKSALRSHLVAAFFLGWAFLSSMRHIWFSAFIRDLMWSLRGIFGRHRGRVDGSIASIRPQREKAAGICPSSFHAEDLNQCKQRDTLLVLLLCFGFLLASLFSFSSLLTFHRDGSGAICGGCSSTYSVNEIPA